MQPGNVETFNPEFLLSECQYDQNLSFYMSHGLFKTRSDFPVAIFSTKNSCEFTKLDSTEQNIV